MKSEAELRSAHVQVFRALDLLAQPIESGLTGLGIPDMYARTHKVSAWFEFKNEHTEPTGFYKVPFRPGQYHWLAKHHKLGGTSVLCIGAPSGIYYFFNKNIYQNYDTPLDASCSYFTPYVDVRKLILVLDNLQDNH